MHHLMLMALVDSYTLFVPGTGFPTGDFSEMAAETVARSFALGFQIALPVVVVGVLIYLAMGLMSRLMPQIQVFFLALPVQMLDRKDVVLGKRVSVPVNSGGCR